MKYLKVVSVMVSCFIAAASVQAMESQEDIVRPEGYRAPRNFEGQFEAHMEIAQKTCIGKAAWFVCKRGISRDRAVFTDAMYEELTEINAQMAALRGENTDADVLLFERGNILFGQVSSAYNKNLDSLSTLRRQLDEIVSRDVWDKNCIPVAVNYMHMLLLNKLGDDQEAGDQKGKAYDLLSRLRKDDTERCFKELFYYFPDTPLAEEGRNNLRTFIEREKREVLALQCGRSFALDHMEYLLNFGERALERVRLSQGAGDAAAASGSE